MLLIVAMQKLQCRSNQAKYNMHLVAGHGAFGATLFWGNLVLQFLQFHLINCVLQGYPTRSFHLHMAPALRATWFFCCDSKTSPVECWEGCHWRPPCSVPVPKQEAASVVAVPEASVKAVAAPEKVEDAVPETVAETLPVEPEVAAQEHTPVEAVP